MDIKINRMEMKVKDIGINWNLRYRLEKVDQTIRNEIDILRKS